MAWTDEQASPGRAETSSAVKALVGSSKTLNVSRQAEAEAFIKEHGAGARNHTAVTADPRVKKAP